VQLHVATGGVVTAYTRQGSRHTTPLPQNVIDRIREHLKPGVYDGEWLRGRDRIYLFDVLYWDKSSLTNLNYTERYILLPNLVTPELVTLPLLKTLTACQRILQQPEDEIEGLVFRLPTARGWPDSAIIRCRRPEYGGIPLGS